MSWGFTVGGTVEGLTGGGIDAEVEIAQEGQTTEMQAAIAAAGEAAKSFLGACTNENADYSVRITGDSQTESAGLTLNVRMVLPS